MAVGSVPETLGCVGWNGPAIETGGSAFVCVANTGLLTVVTFW
jgi:hypothetical protein